MLLLTHFTKQCPKCNSLKSFSSFNKSKRNKYNITSYCKSCTAVCSKQSSERNKESITKRKKIYRIENKEKIHLVRKKYLARNKARIAEYSRQYRLTNKERFVEWEKAYLQTELGRLRSINNNHKRRAIERQGDVTVEQLKNLTQISTHCYWCGIELASSIKTHMDHYVPLSRGGKHTISNLVMACAKCNFTKGAKDPSTFANLIGKIL